MINQDKLAKSTRKFFHTIYLERKNNINEKNRIHNFDTAKNLKLDKIFLNHLDKLIIY